MGLTPLAFTGISSFSQDFQTILKRAVDIAALPGKALQNEQADLIQKKTLAANLREAVASFTSSFESLTAAGDNKGIVASSSASAKVSVSTTSATEPAVYSITNLTSLASTASETSLSGYADSAVTQVSASGTVLLTVGSETKTITLTGATNNLLGLRDEINNAGLDVRATIFTTGNENYLSVTSTKSGATTLTLKEDPAGANTDLLTTANQGTNASFQVNGVLVSKTTNTINDVVPGITFTLNDVTDPGETVTLTLASNRSRLSSGLQSLVSRYNSVVDLVDAQIGETAGLLSGDSLVRSVQNTFRSFTGFITTRTESVTIGGVTTTVDPLVKDLAALGIELDSKGKISFNQATFDALSEAAVEDGFQLVGTAATSLGSLLEDFKALSDSVTGSIQVQINQFDTSQQRISDRVTEITDRVNRLQANLSLRLQQADALLAGLEAQRSVVDASIKGLQLTLFGKNPG
ncbi:MAG: hypothetical protein FJW40_18050 [Acidobacteria bacterium]|nr:hypothetical protein [Acidobacteriota bacterium]